VIEGRASPAAGYKDNMRALALARAADESSRSGRTVALKREDLE
jgi:hypothetical protein